MSFFSELKRRHVIQVGLAYLVIAWGVAQVADLVLDNYQSPQWIMRLVLGGLALGFPVALISAWLYELFSGAGESKSEKEESDPSLLVTQVPSDITVHESIAVLPFVNMSSDPEQEFFSDGISEELLNLLTKIPELRVAARTSAFSFKGTNSTIENIGRKLHVAHILEGSVRTSGDKIRITAKLIKVENGFHLWSETWNRTLDDIFSLQDEIASVVVAHLKLSLLSPIPSVTETNPEAYTLYLQARHLSRQHTVAGYSEALALLEDALVIAPDYAAAWAERASIYSFQAGYAQIDAGDGFRCARQAAQRALQIDPACSQAITELSVIAVHVEHDFGSAAEYLNKALAINPADLTIVSMAARLLSLMGRFDSAFSLFDYLIARDPINPATYFQLGRLHYCAGNIDDGIACCKTALLLAPGQIGTQSLISYSLLALGDAQAALEAAEQEQELFYRLMAQESVFHAMGRQEEADSTLEQLMRDHAEEGAYNIALTLACKGEIDRAFEWLGKALEYSDAGLPEILTQPESVNLHHDPRWGELLTRIGMSPEQLAVIELDVNLPGGG